MSIVNSIFVYGTLQRDEEREQCWPRAPLSVEPAEVRAALYDLGEYPAIISGNDRVAGELWRIRAEELAETLQVLDEIEGFGQGGTDLYVRCPIECQTRLGSAQALTYFLAQPGLLADARRVAPGSDGLCRWHRFR